MQDAGLELRRQDGLGRITLNRPGSINALTAGMIAGLEAVLADWEADPAVRAVLIDGAGPRGLCAGGDIRALHDSIAEGKPEAAHAFLAAEYRLNARIARFPKPYVAIMDGLVMGGGVGVSAHGSVRIVTERTLLAMPEAGIGFLPDAGGTFLLARAPGELGTHAALTGGTMGAADALLCGLADHHVASAALPALVGELAACRDAGKIASRVAAHASPAATGTLAAAMRWIDACYRHDDVPAILHALDACPDEAAQAAGRRLRANCPMSLAVTLRALREARRAGLERCLEQEYRLGVGLTVRPDFVEGVRAAVIRKDRTPLWRPATSGMVDPAEVAALFRADPPAPLRFA